MIIAQKSSRLQNFTEVQVRQIGPGVSFKWETPTPDQNLVCRGLQLHSHGMDAVKPTYRQCSVSWCG